MCVGGGAAGSMFSVSLVSQLGWGAVSGRRAGDGGSDENPSVIGLDESGTNVRVRFGR